MASTETLDISVVIPAYNEEEALPPLLDEVFEVLGSLGRPFEVIVIDDGSNDGTPAFLERRREVTPALRILTLVPNSGQTAAFEAGFTAARGNSSSRWMPMAKTIPLTFPPCSKKLRVWMRSSAYVPIGKTRGFAPLPRSLPMRSAIDFSE